MSFAFDDQGSTVCAHVRQTMQPIVVITAEHQRLVEAPFQKGEGTNMAGSFDGVGAFDELPRTSEHTVFLEIKIRRVGIDARGQRGRLLYLTIDFER